jgi:FkbM family methyltransferase
VAANPRYGNAFCIAFCVAFASSFKTFMRLERATFLNRLAKKCAAPLSYVLCSRLLHNPTRAFDAYLNFLLGKGSGTGWDLQHEIQTALSCVHSERPIVFDVGANVGDWSKGFLAASPQARLYLVEPSPGCQRQIQTLGLPYAALIPCALGDRPGKASLHFSSAVDGSASLHTRGDSYFQDRTYQTVEVEVTTIDQLIAQHQIKFVDFIKMDIEGHELQALQGATNALKEKRIGALSFEFGSGNINSRTYFREFWELLSANNFQLARITPGGRLVPIDEYYEDCEYFRGATNYVARLKDHPKNRPEF